MAQRERGFQSVAQCTWVPLIFLEAQILRASILPSCVLALFCQVPFGMKVAYPTSNQETEDSGVTDRKPRDPGVFSPVSDPARGSSAVGA